MPVVPPSPAATPWSEALSSWDAWLVVAAIAFLVPLRGRIVYRRLLASGTGAIPSAAKLRTYASTIVLQWALAGAAVLVARRHGLTLADLGQRLGNVTDTLALSGCLLALAVAYLLVNLAQLRRPRTRLVVEAVRRFRGLLPADKGELAVFAGVAVTAGFCEELLYRGWLIGFIGAGLGSPWTGVAVGALVFGLAHSYQGLRGMLLTGILGLGFGVLFVRLGTLVPGQTLHAAVDLAGGVIGARAAALQGVAPGSEPAEPAVAGGDGRGPLEGPGP